MDVETQFLPFHSQMHILSVWHNTEGIDLECALHPDGQHSVFSGCPLPLASTSSSKGFFTLVYHASTQNEGKR
jgi:hypothetical protein